MKKIALFTFILATLVGCSSSKDTEQGEQVQINPEFAEYITAFTGGTVNTDATVKVQFNQNIAQDVRDQDHSDAFTLQPYAKGAANWVDERTFEFVPDEPLIAGVRYWSCSNISSWKAPSSVKGLPCGQETDLS